MADDEAGRGVIPWHLPSLGWLRRGGAGDGGGYRRVRLWAGGWFRTGRGCGRGLVGLGRGWGGKDSSYVRRRARHRRRILDAERRQMALFRSRGGASYRAFTISAGRGVATSRRAARGRRSVVDRGTWARGWTARARRRRPDRRVCHGQRPGLRTGPGSAAGGSGVGWPHVGLDWSPASSSPSACSACADRRRWGGQQGFTRWRSSRWRTRPGSASPEPHSGTGSWGQLDALRGGRVDPCLHGCSRGPCCSAWPSRR